MGWIIELIFITDLLPKEKCVIFNKSMKSQDKVTEFKISQFDFVITPL